MAEVPLFLSFTVRTFSELNRMPTLTARKSSRIQERNGFIYGRLNYNNGTKNTITLVQLMYSFKL